MLRDANDADAGQLIALIESIYAEYPGCVLDVDGEAPHLRRPASAFAGWGGRLWVVEDGGHVVACVGYTDHGRFAELKHLYVAAAARRRGLGRELTGLAEEAARAAGHTRMQLWTDTRFTEAHRLYERLGYVRGRRRRHLHDRSRTVEYHYRREL